MTELVEGIKLAGGIAGLVLFGWNIWVALRAYLALALEIRLPDGRDPVIKVSVGNSGLTSKMISYAALLIAPEEVPLAAAVEQVIGPDGKESGSAHPFLRLYNRSAKSVQHKDRCTLIPLNELYEQQSLVGPGETVASACSVNPSLLQPGVTYVVRYFVFVSYAGLYVRWRFTADAFGLPATHQSLHSTSPAGSPVDPTSHSGIPAA